MKMLRRIAFAMSLFACVPSGAAAGGVAAGDPAPEFTHRAQSDWLNSPPLTLQALRGSLVLVDVWAAECWNCYRSFPWVHGLERKYGAQTLRVVGVHTPELPSERSRAHVVAKAAEYGVSNPVMLDNDYSYWNALGNQYWPAWYLIDRQGRLRFAMVGETHAGDANAQRMEAAIERLLAEK